MRNRYKRLMCFFLIIVTFLSGICFENRRADVIFVYAQEAPLTVSEAYLASESLLAPDAQMCTSEMLEGNGTLGIIGAEGRILKGKSDIRMVFSFLCPNSFPLKFSNLFTGKSGIDTFLNSRTILVTNYIHESDGKKRL